MINGIFGGKNKALTFSFNDGNLDDKVLVEISKHTKGVVLQVGFTPLFYHT